MILRSITSLLERKINDRKIIILLGPRQVGKTTLLKNYFTTPDTLWLNGDESDVRTLLTDASSTALKRIVGTKKRLIIDEAQRIPNIGLSLKLIYDEIPHVKVIATGSSSFELSNQVNEPLTGRKWEYHLWPLSHNEMVSHTSFLEENRLLEQRLLYGFYPDVITNSGEEQSIIKQLSDSYLYKDILAWQDIKKPQKLEALLQALAYQIGQEVSYQELGRLTGMDNQTVERYINLLEKAFVVFRLPSLARNLRNELKKSRKIYFYDLGIRNAIINNWKPLALRQDTGAMWENFLIVERLKFKAYNSIFTNDYFWRTHAQQEIDFIEDYQGKLHAYEFKWNNKRSVKFSKSFTSAYPDNKLMVVNQENYFDFISQT
ncbi:ATP-binding protein [Dokdonia sinensis]|uniref:ATP-binding protein n=1 Tax=Dokdonia sinensis TaxID=2479847 RepID=A0A3M0GGM8_9FLAO|nr:ATP-binding protein [Dokdonia sinensis]RMB63438.1 ATP-binding protein [Dokdonia sinensis]